MDTLDLKEKLWGGVFGIIAIIAAICEMFVVLIANLVFLW